MKEKDPVQSGCQTNIGYGGCHYKLASEICVSFLLLKIRAFLKWRNKRHAQYLETTEESAWTEAFIVPKAPLQSSC